jgi:hypothetical protein
MNWLHLCHTSSVQNTSDSSGPVTRKGSGKERAGETLAMTSAVGGSHLPESLSGPCRWLRYRELKSTKVPKGDWVRVTRGRKPRRQRLGWWICTASWGAGATSTNTMCTQGCQEWCASPDVSVGLNTRLNGLKSLNRFFSSNLVWTIPHEVEESPYFL